MEYEQIKSECKALISEFDNIKSCILEHGPDGIPVSDLEFYLDEFVTSLFSFRDKL